MQGLSLHRWFLLRSPPAATAVLRASRGPGGSSLNCGAMAQERPSTRRLAEAEKLRQACPEAREAPHVAPRTNGHDREAMFVELTNTKPDAKPSGETTSMQIDNSDSDDSSDGIELERVYSMWQHDYYENHFTSWADWDRHHSER